MPDLKLTRVRVLALLKTAPMSALERLLLLRLARPF